MSKLELRTFSVDVTPPVGMVVCGWWQPAIGVETPLEMRGLILSRGGEHHVVAAIDYCYTIGRSHRRFEQALADGAGVPVARATIHSNHVHDAPVFNEEIHELMARHSGTPTLHDEAHVADVLDRAQRAVRDALAAPGTEVGSAWFSAHPVEQFGSTRRCVDERNKCHIRWSSGNEPGSWIKEYPEGRIDPDLCQIGFCAADGEPVACMNFYASHPQVSNGRRLWSGDTVEVARTLFEQVHPGVFPIYFSGCGGDVTAGKYTTNIKPRDRLVFGARLFDAMHAAFEKRDPAPPGELEWKDHTFEMPLAQIPEDEAHFRDAVSRPGADDKDRYLPALKLLRLERNIHAYPFRLTRLGIGDIAALFLPTELIVDYQIHARDRGRYRGLGVAAYGDCFLNYVAIAESFPQGGYEVQPNWTEVDERAERLIKDAIDAILE